MEWISTKDRLPEIPEGEPFWPYIVLLNDGKIRIYDCFRFTDEIKFVRHEDVTHWMPLPDPPQEATP